MHLTIAGFHARFTAPDEDGLLNALRKLRRLADFRQFVVATNDWMVWAIPEDPGREALSPTRG